MGPERWLIVSNDLYLELSEDNMLAVPIRDTSSPGSRVVTEPIPDVGQAVLDRITALPRTLLIGDDPESLNYTPTVMQRSAGVSQPDRPLSRGRACTRSARTDRSRTSTSSLSVSLRLMSVPM